MNRFVCCLFLLTAFPVFSQQRVLPIGSSFKDLVFSPSKARLNGPSVFPVSEKDAALYTFIKDSTKRYSTFGHFLYQRQLIEIRDKDAKLWITPLFDFSYGAEFQDTARKRSQNTRGVRMEGTLGKRIFFTTSFYENQAFLPSYVSDYVSQRGEQYPVAADSSYASRNAVIPGAARTKAFKERGYDYAYATGMVSFFATSKLEIHWGNQPLFVGTGHRSLLWSDNSVGTMNLRMRYRFSDKWDLQFVRARGLNLLRRPVATNGEAYYEPKSLSFATLYFQPAEHISIGLFEGGTWYRGDSISQRGISALYFLPVPGAAVLQEAIDNSAFAVLGLDFKAGIGKQLVYGQLAISPSESKSMAAQLGVRLFPLKDPLVQVQLEYNHADKNAYTSQNARLNYSNYNLPVAHPMAAGFDEILLRICWQKNYWFATVQTNVYLNQSEDYTQLMPTVKTTVSGNQQVINQLVEIGYRFNRDYGFETFAGFRYRFANSTGPDYERSWVNIGIRTQLNNHYFDF